jgi:hypothetical protein
MAGLKGGSEFKGTNGVVRAPNNRLALLLPDTDNGKQQQQTSKAVATNNHSACGSDGQGHGGRGVRSVGRE